MFSQKVRFVVKLATSRSADESFIHVGPSAASGKKKPAKGHAQTFASGSCSWKKSACR